MRKIGIAGVLLLVWTVFVSAIGFSASLRGGGGIALGGDTIEVFGLPSLDLLVDGSGNYMTYSNRFVALGSGVILLAGVDVELIKYFSLEFLGGYFYGPKMTFSDFKPAPGVSVHGSYTASVIPAALTLKAKVPLGKLVIYAGAGPSFGFAAKAKAVIDSDDGVDQEHSEAEITFKPGLGYHGVFGAEFSLSKNLSLIAEARGEQLTFTSKGARITVYTVNGTDQLSTFVTADREIEYVDDLSAYENSPYDPDVPTQELAFHLPADSIHGFIGIVIRF
jgi:hypothetical protein